MLSAKVLKQTGKLSRCIVHLLPKMRHDLSCSEQDGACGARRCGKPPFPMHGCTVSLGPWPPLRAPSVSPCQVFGGGGSGPAQRPCSRGRPQPTGAMGKGSLTVVLRPTPACGELLLPEGLVPAWATAPPWQSPTLPGRRPCWTGPRCRLTSWPSPPPKAQGGGTGPTWPPPGNPHHYWPPRRCWPQRCPNNLKW